MSGPLLIVLVLMSPAACHAMAAGFASPVP